MINPEKPKIEEEIKLENNKREVWIIDDDEKITEAILRIWKLDLEKLGVNFIHFLKAKEALEELEKRLKKKEIIPGIIFVDYQLEKDEKELRRGENLIKKIREIQKIVQPIIIAHSSVEECNKRMQEAGADFAFQKMDCLKSRDFLKDIIQKENEK